MNKGIEYTIKVLDQIPIIDFIKNWHTSDLSDLMEQLEDLYCDHALTDNDYMAGNLFNCMPYDYFVNYMKKRYANELRIKEKITHDIYVI